MSRPHQPDIGQAGPVPPGNQPGHHPPEEQDKPDLDAFAAKLSAHDVTEAEAAAAERRQRQREAVGPNDGGESPYMRWALYPVRLVTHAAKWSKEYFEAGRTE